MESEVFDIRNLREWYSINDVLQKIPSKIQKGLFFHELNLTCIDAVCEFLVFGSDVGIVFWYNRKNGKIQELRTGSSAAITCIKLISSVEYLVAVGNTKGEVTIFQIQKELPNEFKTDEIAASLITTKPIERYTIKGVDRAPITCVEWSKNGMKLFSGDANGVVMLTEFDFSDHISKTIEILNEKHEIVQMNFSKPWLLVSTIYRAIVCRRTNENQWNVSQIGRTDRKVMNNFGAVFTPTDVNDPKKVPNIICSRPGFRFWMADCDGNVSHTYLLKNSVYEARSVFEVPLLTPVHNKMVNISDTYFGQCHFYLKKFIVTFCDAMIFIINLEELKVMATIKRLRKIQYLAINNNEIFILEGGHSIVRLATVSSIIITNGIEQLQNVENGKPKIVQADECFELPPIECIELNVPLACQLNEHNLLKEDKLLLEHSRKLEVFEKINTLDYDDSILFNGGTKKKKKNILDGSINGENGLNGIVEIGRQAEFIDRTNEQTNTGDTNENTFSKQNGTKSFGINVKSRLKEANTFIGTFNGHDKLNSIAKCGQNRLSEISDSIIDGRIETDPSVTPGKSQKRMEFSYPSYPEIGVQIGMEETNNYYTNGESKLNTKCNTQEHKKTTKNASVISLDRLKDFPPFANIPKLWDIKIERYDDENNRQSPENGSSEISPGDDGIIINNDWVLL